MHKVNLAEKLSQIDEYWRPKVVGELNGQEVKLVNFKGEFVWHHQEREDELFLVVRGSFRVDFRDRVVSLAEGEFVIVPHGVEHRTVADDEVHVLIFEPAATRNTGNVEHETFTVAFELDGQLFTALNAGPAFKFNEAISFQVLCDTQQEIDSYWQQRSEGGDPKAQQCGWLKDKFGVSWQVDPKVLSEMLSDPDATKAGRVMDAMLKMRKIDIATLERAYGSK